MQSFENMCKRLKNNKCARNSALGRIGQEVRVTPQTTTSGLRTVGFWDVLLSCAEKDEQQMTV